MLDKKYSIIITYSRSLQDTDVDDMDYQYIYCESKKYSCHYSDLYIGQVRDIVDKVLFDGSNDLCTISIKEQDFDDLPFKSI